MSYTQIHAIIQKLNAVCQKSLQMAAASCLEIGCDTIELNHWLMQLLILPQSDMHLLLQHAGINISAWLADLSQHNKPFAKTASKAPILSSAVEELLRESYYIANLEYQTEEIRSGFLLFALLNSDYLLSLLSRLSHPLSQLPKEQLRAQFSLVTKDSSENKRMKAARITPSENQRSALTKFTHNLTELASAGKLDPVIGREHEIQQLIDILMRRRQNNPLLVGDPGVGKTALVEGLAQRIITGAVPTALRRASIHSVDIHLLQAGAHDSSELNNRIQQLLHEIQLADRPILLFIDEAHALLTSGPSELVHQIKPLLARGELRTIAATTWTEYRRYWERDQALNRRFQLIKVEEVTEEATIAILNALRPSLELHHRVQISDQAIPAAVQLSIRYLTDRQLPDKAINLLDTACARLALAQEEKMASPANAPGCSNEVDMHAIVEVIAHWTATPLSQIHGSELQTLLHLEQQMQQRIFGQSQALREWLRIIQLARTQLLDSQRPMGIVLLVGPSGVGKTTTAQTLADLLYGGAQQMTVINLAEYHEAHRVSQLIGSPPGYIGFGEAALLTEAVRRRPHHLIVLEEWEKAHAQVRAIFYQIFDKGWLYDSEGRITRFNNTLFIVTSTAAADLILRLCSNHENPDAEVLSQAIRGDLISVFDADFLSRVDIIPYYPLTTTALQQIVQQQLHILQKRVAQRYQIILSYRPHVVDFIVHACQDIRLGANRIMQMFNRKLLPLLAAECLAAAMKKPKITDMLLEVDVEKDEFLMTSYPPSAGI